MESIEIPMNSPLTEKTLSVMDRLCEDRSLSRYVDCSIPLPQTFHGPGPVKLIVLGQDPTVMRSKDRQAVLTVLNLHRKGSLWNYLMRICRGLGISINENVFATNLYKNFFTAPPLEIKDINIFSTFLPHWLPLLQEELEQFPGVPVVTLGQPVLQALLTNEPKRQVRDFWGFSPEWRWEVGPFEYVGAEENLLGRRLFPFPHQPSLRVTFYKTRLMPYISFMKKCIEE